MLQNIPRCLQEPIRAVKSLNEFEKMLMSAWPELVMAPADCAAFLNSVVELRTPPGATSGAAPRPPDGDSRNEDTTALCSVYCAAALTVRARLDVVDHAASSVLAGARGTDDVGSPETESTFAFLSGAHTVAGWRTHDHEDVALSTAEALVNIVEQFFMPSKEAYRLLRASLSRQIMGMPLLGIAVRGYAGYMLSATRCPHAAGARCLRVLARMIFCEESPYVNVLNDLVASSAGAFPDPPAGPLSPTHQTSRLSVAHATYLYVARVTHLPAAGLTLLLDNPVLLVDTALDGVALSDYIGYYTEGAALLAELGRYPEAAECLYNVAVLDYHDCFEKQLLSSLKAERIIAMQLVKPPQVPKMVIPNGYSRSSNPTEKDYVPSDSEVALAYTLYQRACKMCVLLTIMGFGGANGCRAVGAATGSASTRTPCRATHLLAEVIAKDNWALPTFKPYQMLWKHATQCDLTGFMKVIAESNEALESDGLLRLAMQAMERLRRFVLLNMATVYDTVPLPMVVQATSLSHIELLSKQAVGRPTDDRSSHLQGAGSSRITVDDQQEAICLLTSMQEEGQLLTHLSRRSQRPHTSPSKAVSENEEATQDAANASPNDDQWVVDWIPPSILSAEDRRNYLAHRATYGNCSNVTYNVSTAVSSASPAGSGALPTPSTTSALLVAAIWRADAVRAYLVAAESSVSVWKNQLQLPRQLLESFEARGGHRHALSRDHGN